MDTEDQRLKCVDCGQEFLFTGGEQSFYKQHGLTNAPTRCKTCREARKSNRASGSGSAGGRPREKELFSAVCADCGIETQIPFPPTQGRPVYCRNCFQSHKGTQSSGGSGGGRGGAGGGGRGAGGGFSRGAGGGGGRGGSGGGGDARGHAGGPRRSSGPMGGRPSAPMPPSSGNRQQGAVKWFNEAKGFGFIQDEAGEEIFVHFSSIASDGFKTLTEGDRVEYDVVPGPKGQQAANVVRVS